MRWQRRTKSRLYKTLATLTFGGVVVGMVAVVGVVAYVSKDLPSPDKVVRQEGFATKLYDRNGKLLYDVYSDQERTPVDLPDVPMSLRQATIAIEDKNFYSHKGFDPLGIFRALFRSFVYRRLEGGSTLTQQLVKNTLLTQQQTISRKVKEFILALQVERKYSKDQILQMYLNEAPYGGTAWGVESASETYFGKPVGQIDLAQAAILAGLPQSPSYYSPYVGNAYVNRANDVLRRMQEDGYITKAQETAAKAEVPKIVISTQSAVLQAPHFVFYVRQLLVDKYGEKAVETGGLRVTTTLDLDLQKTAQTAVTEEINKVKYLNITNGAAVVQDTTNGQILAMVGSRGWSDPDYDGKFNVATQGLRQPGSSIKPVVYLTGLRKGYTAASLFMDTKTSFPGGDKPEYVPENYDGKFHGPLLMRDAIGNSINVPAVKMVALVGVKDVLQMGYEMGFSTLNPTADMLKRVGLSVALGGGEVHLIDMTTAYSAFANGGHKVEPVAILKVADSQGRVLEENKGSEGKQVISPEEAFIMSSMLADPSARTITFGPHSSIEVPGRTIAVKTGTTNDKRDNWTVGWTANGIITGVWVGNNNNTSMKQVASGITGAAPIWNRIIKAALTGKPNQDFATASGIVAMDIDKTSGYPAHDGFDAKREFFIRGTEPAGPDPIHKMIKMCRGGNQLAGPSDVASGNYDQKEAFYFHEDDPFIADDKTNKWQEGIDAWLAGQNDPKYHPPTDYCGNTNPMWIVLTTPADKSRINSNDVEVKLDIQDPNKVTEVNIYVDGNLKETLTNPPWDVTVNMSDGNHRIEVKAKDEKGFDGSRYVDIGVNQDYSAP